MRILAIETSCDETSVAVICDGTTIAGHALATSVDIQAQYGGIVPEVASRKQAEFIIPVLTQALNQSGDSPKTIDAIAVTVGPGLVGSLLVGIETAKTLSYIWQKPLLPINHLVGHLYSGWLDQTAAQPPQFPLIGLVASGGHTDLVLMRGHGVIEHLGQTLDDAVGEAFDKVARVMNLGYPGGPAMEKSAQTGDPNAFKLPRPMITSPDLNFSYSGLKTAAAQTLETLPQPPDSTTLANLAASFQQAAFDVLVTKTLSAVAKYQPHSLLVTGGVAANQHLKQMFHQAIANIDPPVTLHIPPLNLATDNATYIGSTAYFTQHLGIIDHRSTELLMLRPLTNLAVDQTDIIELLQIPHENSQPSPTSQLANRCG